MQIKLKYLTEQVVYFQKQIIVSFWVILQLPAEVLQSRCSQNTLHNPRENKCVEASILLLFNKGL